MKVTISGRTQHGIRDRSLRLSKAITLDQPIQRLRRGVHRARRGMEGDVRGTENAIDSIHTMRTVFARFIYRRYKLKDLLQNPQG